MSQPRNGQPLRTTCPCPEWSAIASGNCTEGKRKPGAGSTSCRPFARSSPAFSASRWSSGNLDIACPSYVCSFARVAFIEWSSVTLFTKSTLWFSSAESPFFPPDSLRHPRKPKRPPSPCPLVSLSPCPLVGILFLRSLLFTYNLENLPCAANVSVWSPSLWLE